MSAPDMKAVEALCVRLEAVEAIYNRGPDYSPLMVEPGPLRIEAAEALRALLSAYQKGERTIAGRDRRIKRLLWAMGFAREKGVVFPADEEQVVLSRSALTSTKDNGHE